MLISNFQDHWCLNLPLLHRVWSYIKRDVAQYLLLMQIPRSDIHQLL